MTSVAFQNHLLVKGRKDVTIEDTFRALGEYSGIHEFNFDDLLLDTFTTGEHPILIHCQAGADRAGAASAIWRMTVAGDDRQDALEELDCRYGHFKEFTPAMDWVAEVFVPDANWIRSEYDPNGFAGVQAEAEAVP